ncbi:S-adenosylmethionine uptake transporter [Geopseudomonas sagittaria]|uniref:S-adenosylmethionine uptake transporter n=2 Tax=Geopseudomonas sagittaria TaxID=1135990 RepID=A0A1I5Q756_9GAMM|nr:S-adenosylmethionine uptake transporter [Pseudomonas sagittaria]
MSRPLKGILLTCAAVFAFASLDSLSKYLTAFNSVLMILWVRYLAQTCLLAAWQLPRHGLRVLKVNCPGLQVLRGLSLLSISLFFLFALRYLPIGEATAVHFLTPLLVILLAIPMLGERASLAQWLLVAVGFAGVLIIVRPGGGLLTPAMLLPVASACSYAIFQLLTRRIGSRDSAAATNLITGLVGFLCLTLLLPLFWTGLPAWPQLLGMISLGLIAVTGHMLLTVAFQYSSPVLLAPFSYLQIFFAVLYGFLLFDHAPDSGALLGMGVIALSGLGSAWLQARRHA